MFSIARQFGVSLDALIAANPQIPNPSQIRPGQVVCIPQTQTVCPPGTFRYTVQPGDTMFSIAQRFGVPLDELIAANPQIPNPNLIFRDRSSVCPKFSCPPTHSPTRFSRETQCSPSPKVRRITQRPDRRESPDNQPKPDLPRPDRLRTENRRPLPCRDLCLHGTARRHNVHNRPEVWRIAECPYRRQPADPQSQPDLPWTDCLCAFGLSTAWGCPSGTFAYTVRPGDTMFNIARRFGVSLDALIKANPQIPNPNQIRPGQIVCVPTR